LCNGRNHPDGCDCGFGPPYDRDIPEYFDHHVGSDDGRNLSSAGPHSASLGLLIGNDHVTTQIVSTFLWQSYLGRPATELIGRIGKACTPETSPMVYIVRHGRGQPRHDLLIFDPLIPNGQVKQGYVDMSPAELQAGWQHFRNKYDVTNASVPRWLSGFSLEEVSDIAVEAISAQRHFFIAKRPPHIVWTSSEEHSLAKIPSGALAVSKKIQSKFLSTVGVFSSDDQGRTGVTTALHAFENQDASVFVNGISGKVQSKDTITDSCFIEVDYSQLPSFGTCNGPLVGVTPGQGETVLFDGATSGKVETFVNGWTPELPWIIPGVQSRIITPPVTNGGDSGAALMNQRGNVIGFAQYRTGFKAKSPHSAWIWAESVFSALHLK